MHGILLRGGDDQAGCGPCSAAPSASPSSAPWPPAPPPATCATTPPSPRPSSSTPPSTATPPPTGSPPPSSPSAPCSPPCSTGRPRPRRPHQHRPRLTTAPPQLPWSTGISLAPGLVASGRHSHEPVSLTLGHKSRRESCL